MKKKRAVRAAKNRKNKISKKRLFTNKDKYYGRFAQKPNFPEEKFAKKKTDFSQNLQLNEEQRIQIFEETFSKSLFGLEGGEKKNFGSVCNRLPFTSYHSLVKNKKICYTVILKHKQ